MAVNFLNGQKAENIPNIGRLTESLLQGAALILAAASEDVDHSKSMLYTENAKVNVDLLFFLKVAHKASIELMCPY